MSRTYRKFPVFFCGKCDKPSTRTTPHIKGHPDSCECSSRVGVSFYRKVVKASDHKPWYKPPKWFKKQERQQFRAQSKQALHRHVYKGKDFIPPINRKSDQWNWM